MSACRHFKKFVKRKYLSKYGWQWTCVWPLGKRIICHDDGNNNMKNITHGVLWKIIMIDSDDTIIIV